MKGNCLGSWDGRLSGNMIIGSKAREAAAMVMRSIPTEVVEARQRWLSTAPMECYKY